MAVTDKEEKLLHSVVLQNANSILVARQSAEEELVQAKVALELKAEQLARSLARVRAMLESTSDAILVTDVDAKITDFNSKYLRMWALPRALVESGNH